MNFDLIGDHHVYLLYKMKKKKNGMLQGMLMLCVVEDH